MDLFAQIKASVDEIIRVAKEKAADGLTFKEVMALLYEASAEFIKLAQATGALGPDKKAAVLQAWDTFVKEVILPLDLPGPDWMLDPVVEKVLHDLADAAIEGILKILKNVQAV